MRRDGGDLAGEWMRLPPLGAATVRLVLFGVPVVVFPAARGGMLSDMTLSATMRRIHEAATEAGGKGYLDRVTERPAVPHGLRSTFRDWVAERTTYPGEMAEVALAHRISNTVEAAYRRGDMVEKRRRMTADGSTFLLASNQEKKANTNKSNQRKCSL